MIQYAYRATAVANRRGPATEPKPRSRRGSSSSNHRSFGKQSPKSGSRQGNTENKSVLSSRRCPLGHQSHKCASRIVSTSRHILLCKCSTRRVHSCVTSIVLCRLIMDLEPYSRKSVVHMHYDQCKSCSVVLCNCTIIIGIVLFLVFLIFYLHSRYTIWYLVDCAICRGA